MDGLENDAWDRMIAGLREGDQRVCSDFWEQFCPALESVARNQLSERLQDEWAPTTWFNPPVALSFAVYRAANSICLMRIHFGV